MQLLIQRVGDVDLFGNKHPVRRHLPREKNDDNLVKKNSFLFILLWNFAKYSFTHILAKQIINSFSSDYKLLNDIEFAKI